MLIGLLDLGYQLIPHDIIWKLIGPYDAKLSNLCEKRKYSVDPVREKIVFESFLLKRERGTNGNALSATKKKATKFGRMLNASQFVLTRTFRFQTLRNIP